MSVCIKYYFNFIYINKYLNLKYLFIYLFVQDNVQLFCIMENFAQKKHTA